MYSERLTDRARGRWSEIIRALAPHPIVLEAIERARAYPRDVLKQKTACPLHGGKSNRAFRVLPDFEQNGHCVCNSCGSKWGFGLLMWLNGWDAHQTASALAAYLNRRERIAMPPRPYPTPTVSVSESDAPPKGKTRQQLQAWIDEAFGLPDARAGPARRYLDSRGLAGIRDLPSLRGHPDLECGWRHLPALIAPYQHVSGRLVGLHRIFLTDEGQKAPIPEPKMSIRAREEASLAGSALQLMDAAGPILGVAEGLETALSVFLATGMPMWAATNTALLGGLIVPACVQRLVIWADYDELKILPNGTVVEPGRQAAERLTARMRAEYRAVRTLYPTMLGRRGVDWNDVWVELGAAGFPKFNFNFGSLPTVWSLLRRRSRTQPKGPTN
ncbi:MAG: toprim domain-containing protein [Steroidobacteraceae bacterium]